MENKIEAFEILSMEAPIHVPFSISKETLAVARFALVKISDDSGQEGVGECSPFPSLTGDTLEAALPLAKELANSLCGLTPSQAMRSLRLLQTEAFKTSRTAYVGVESALWSLSAKQKNIPLHKMFGSASKKSIETDITLPIMPPENVANFWNTYKDYGFNIIKIKVSGRVQEDLDLIQAMKELLPSSCKITLDGNQGYNVPGALNLLKCVQGLGITPLFFEQPLPADDWLGLKNLSEKTAIPICVDETVVTAEDAKRVANDQVAGLINLKIMKSSIAETLSIIEVAQSAGIKLMIGGMLESEIAMGISLNIAAGTGAIEYADLDTPFFFKKHVTSSSPWHAKRALLSLL